jgi:predicted outer membrane repeat protein
MVQESLMIRLKHLTPLTSALALAIFAGAALADPTPVYVNAAATGANTGASWPDAYTDLPSALQSAPAGAPIWVAQGLYYPAAAGAPVSSTFSLRSGTALYGGFAGDETALDQRNPSAHPTILSGDLGRNDPANLFDNARHVVTAAGVDTASILDGFTIRAGAGSGAALLVTAGGPTVRGCLFIDNRAASGEGGAVYASSATTLTFTQCRFENNSTSTGSTDWGTMGGAIYATGSTLTIDRCLFFNNRTGNGSWGGCTGGNPLMGSPGGFGGAVGLRSCTATISASRFIANRTGDGGSGASCVFGTRPAGAGGDGAAIFALFGSVTVVNCAFDTNRTGAGGPSTSGPSGTVPAGPNGAYTAYAMNPAVLANCTFINNKNPTGANLDLAYSAKDNCLVWTPGDPATPTDPRFVDADGPDNILGTADDNLRLSLASPYIDAGNNSFIPAGFTTDAAGSPRFVDIPTVTDTGSGTPPIIDVGAYETQPCRADFNASGVVSVQDIFDFLTAYFSFDPLADFNGEGGISVQDIFDFLAAYFTGCS